jgi:hypothetical protein
MPHTTSGYLVSFTGHDFATDRSKFDCDEIVIKIGNESLTLEMYDNKLKITSSTGIRLLPVSESQVKISIE